jgi:hypothetical protein
MANRLLKLVVWTLVALSLSGCTKTVITKLAAYQPGAHATTQPIPVTNAYIVKVYGRDGQLHGIDGTARVLRQGDPVGFHTDDAGVVHAVADGESFDLPPTRGQKVVWYTMYEKQTQFGKEVNRALVVGGQAAGVAAIVGDCRCGDSVRRGDAGRGRLR